VLSLTVHSPSPPVLWPNISSAWLSSGQRCPDLRPWFSTWGVLGFWVVFGEAASLQPYTQNGVLRAIPAENLWNLTLKSVNFSTVHFWPAGENHFSSVSVIVCIVIVLETTGGSNRQTHPWLCRCFRLRRSWRCFFHDWLEDVATTLVHHLATSGH